MKAVARILLLLLIVAFSVRLIAASIVLLAAFQHPGLVSYAMGRLAFSAVLLAFVTWAFRRMSPSKAIPPPLPGREG